MEVEKVSKAKFKRGAKYIGNAVTILSVIYIAISVGRMDIDINRLPNKEKVLIWSALGIVITIISLFLLSYSWMQPLQWLGNKKINFLNISSIYLRSNIGKYLPGNVAHYVERNLFAMNIGIRQVYIAISSGLECIIIVVTAIGISVLFSYKELVRVFDSFGILKWIKIGLAAGVVLFVVLSIIFLHIPKVKNILKDIRSTATIKSGFGVLIKMIVCDAIMLYGNGICFSIICWSISGTVIDAKQFMYFINCYILAWVVGYCIPGAPGGIGVRELVIILLVQNTVNSDLVVLTALIHRIVTILGDLSGYGISRGIKTYLRKKNFKKDCFI